MIDSLLTLTGLLKGFTYGIGSKTGQASFEKVKEIFAPPIADKIGKALHKAFNNQLKLDEGVEDQTRIFEDDEYYSQLIYGFDLINGEDLSPYHKNKSKLFLVELFKDDKLKSLLFNEKLDYIKKDTIEIKSTAHDIKKKLIYSLKEDSKFDEFISGIDFENFPHYYIPRQISVGTDWFYMNKISSFKELIDYCANKQNKQTPIRILIIADGGIGKSVYLKQLAKECSKDKNWHPVFISLRDLKPNDVLQDYIERRHPSLEKVDPIEYNQLCLFLDGFDEIGDSTAAVKQIGDLCSTYPHTNIILTSRRNSFFNQLPDFSKSFVFTLVDINDDNIGVYIETAYKEADIDVHHFFNEINENKFNNLIYNPFYLDVLINCYIDNNKSLKISKKVLIENLITKRREKDKAKRPDLELEKPTNKLKLLQLGKKFAFTQALMDQRNLPNDDIARLFNDDFDLAINSLPIRKGSDVKEVQSWELEHNIFLEHLVADVLKTLELRQILEYATSNNKVKSKWRDIISHLLGILDKNIVSEKELYESLINWLIENDFELLLKVEDSQLPKDVRSKIFMQIYQWYKEKTIWIDTNKIDIKQMALFGETKENVSIIFSDIIDVNNHYRQRVNASFLFQHFVLNDFTKDEISEMSQKYTDVIVSIPDNRDNEALISYFIYNYPFANEDLISLIIRQFRNSQSSSIISNIVHVIKKNDLQDKYIVLLIRWYEGIEKNERNAMYTDFNTDSAIVLCFSNLKKSESYIKLFDFLQNSHLYYNLTTYDMNDIKSIILKSLECYNKEVLNSAIELSLAHSRHSLKDWEPFEIFFQNDAIRKDAINMILSKLTNDKENDIRDWKYIGIIAKIAKEEDLSSLYSSIDSREFYVTLYNWTIEGTVKNNLLQYLNDKYQYIPTVKNNPWPEREKKEFDILFDKERFQRECLGIFDELNTDSIIPDKLYKYEMKDKYWNRSLLSFLSSFGRRKDLTKAALISWFDSKNEDVEYFLNAKINSNIPRWGSDQTMPEFTNEQLGQIKLYYEKHVKETSFVVTINKDKENSYSMSPIAPLLINYMQRFNFNCTDDKLCEMLGNLYADFDFIVRKIKDKELLKNAIQDNLKNYKNFFSGHVLKQVIYAIDNNILEVKDYIVEIIKDPKFDKYHKTEIVIYCIGKNRFVSDIFELYSYLKQSQRLTLCKKLIEIDYPDKSKIKDLLFVIVENPENDKIKLTAISLLIWQKNEDALNLLIDYCKEHSIIAIYDPFYNTHVGIEMPDNYLQYDDIKVLPLLIELLELSLNPIISPKNSRGHLKIENNIIHLALLSEDNYTEVILTLEQFMSDNKGKYPDIEILNFMINRIEELRQESQSKHYTFREAQEICNKIIN